ncbi:FAD-dependent monooxygenase [Amycolatopsis carbonis]|uniref:FAD-dependent monooxygenase n=1 Tax=Amycolatopsis carbonis TaxID=715471 RepID=A0A9Y2IDL9_9PSEU|nr:FAD-dependent monooxygenase [Amycolatopsis sp. 2-15]WIX77061.1 FAD-dependent monooxygenase [Amycolatopsis sp. 2-15]
MTRSDIAIIGAGIGGLTLGLALRRHGIRSRIYEQAPELAEVGAAVALAANGIRVLRDLGIGSALEETSAVPTELVYRHWSHGDRLAAHPVGAWYEDRFGAPFWGVHRAHLQRALAQAWGTADLHLGKELTGLCRQGDSTELTFADGSSTTAGLVVGADGIRSRVRVSITDVVPVYSGTSGFRGLVTRDDVPDLPDPDAVQFWLGQGAHLLHYATGEFINFLAVLEGPKRWTAPGGVANTEDGLLAAAFRGWHPAVRTMIDAVPQGPQWGLFALPPLARWSNDGAVLLGDAAHAMMPHHGQGANQTIEDAAVLADCQNRFEDVHTALAGYERLRRSRTCQVQRSSWVTSALLHLPDGDAAATRDRRLLDLVDDFSWIHE